MGRCRFSPQAGRNALPSPPGHLLDDFLIFLKAALVFGLDAHDFMRVEQIAEGIGSIPDFMLPPHAADDGSGEERIDVYEFGWIEEAFETLRIEPKPLAAKKSDAPQEMASKQRRSVSERLYSSPSTP